MEKLPAKQLTIAAIVHCMNSGVRYQDLTIHKRIELKSIMEFLYYRDLYRFITGKEKTGIQPA